MGSVEKYIEKIKDRTESDLFSTTFNIRLVDGKIKEFISSDFIEGEGVNSEHWHWSFEPIDKTLSFIVGMAPFEAKLTGNLYLRKTAGLWLPKCFLTCNKTFYVEIKSLKVLNIENKWPYNYYSTLSQNTEIIVEKVEETDGKCSFAVPVPSFWTEIRNEYILDFM